MHPVKKMSSALYAFLAPPCFAASILFDHTMNETAGNADWVIDAQEPVPEPAQSGITPSTSGTFWTGAISSWGIALVKRGHTVATLASGDSITYGQPANPRDLSRFKVYVVCEPQRPFRTGEKKALFDFVRNGGGLFMVADHDVSDRDSFGLYFNSQGDPGALSNFSETSQTFNLGADDSIVNGPGGKAVSLAFHNGTSITLFPARNPTATGHCWRAANPQALLCASARFGKGKVVGLGDSSPADDSTGSPGNTLYNGWSEGGDSAVIINATAWLAAGSTPTGLNSPNARVYFRPCQPGLLGFQYDWVGRRIVQRK